MRSKSFSLGSSELLRASVFQKAFPQRHTNCQLCVTRDTPTTDPEEKRGTWRGCMRRPVLFLLTQRIQPAAAATGLSSRGKMTFWLKYVILFSFQKQVCSSVSLSVKGDVKTCYCFWFDAEVKPDPLHWWVQRPISHYWIYFFKKKYIYIYIKTEQKI